MQLLTSLSKNLIAIVLTLALLMVWDSANVPLTGIDHSYEPAQIDNPIEESSQSQENLWNTISQGFKLDHQEDSKPVQTEIRKLLADEDKLNSILKAAGPYLYFIHQQTQARGLPAELALIPVIESEYNPNDHSNKGALGLWQLMSGTAHELGIKIKSGYDGRRNVIASTKAALAYFNDLGNSFKDNWYLAIAAYNCGQGKVQSAERRAGSTSFWNLNLPKETKQYVPKLLAVAAIVEDPAKYGVTLPQINNEPYFTAVKVNKTVSLNQVAKSSGVSVQTLKTLNPDYKNGTIPQQKDGATLLVPVDKAESVKAEVQST